MRIIEWNSNMAFRKKNVHILKYHPDILIVPECENQESFNRDKQNHIADNFIWVGNNRKKGIGIFSYSKDYALQIHSSYSAEFKYIVPIQVLGKSNFLLLAIWSCQNEFLTYIGQIKYALQYYADLLSQSCMLVGDWNSNAIWDGFLPVAESLKQKNIQSAYHSFFSEGFGKELHPTLYFQRNQAKPYHIDYCFATSDFITDLHNVEIGKYNDWIAWSDHMPMILDFRDKN